MQIDYKTDLFSLFPVVSEKLLRMKDSNQALYEVLEALGKATNSDRVYYFSNTVENGVYGCRYQTEWCNDGITPEINNPLVAFAPWEDLQFIHDEFDRKQSLTMCINNLEGEFVNFKEYLESQKIISLHLIKVHYENRFLGFVGFDSCKKERVWTSEEIKLLEYLADIISHRLIRDEASENINTLLENSNRRNRFLVAVRELNKKGFDNNQRKIFKYLVTCLKDLLMTPQIGIMITKESKLKSIVKVTKEGSIDDALSSYINSVSLTDKSFLDSKKLNDLNIKDFTSSKLLIIPLNVGSKSLGVIIINNLDEDTYQSKIPDFNIAIDVVTSLMVSIIQTNENKAIQRKIEEQKIAFESVLETVLSGYWYWDVSQNNEFISQGLHAALGYDVENNPIKSLESVIHKDDLTLFKKHIKAKAWMVSRSTYLEQFRFIHLSGNELILRMGITVIERSPKGNPLRIMGCIIDVTNDAKLSEKLRDNLEKEKDLNKMKSHFVSLVSHQFRTPMAIIQSNLELIDTYVNMGEKKKTHSSIKRIELEIGKLNNLISKVLTMQSSSDNEYLQTKTDINLIPFISDLISRFNKVNQVQVILEKDDNIKNILLHLNKVKLENILDNLISNALKYGQGEDVKVIMKRTASSEIQISIVDFGIGIPKQHIGDVFLPFHRASNAENFIGTGLGLSIVKEFCDDLGIGIFVHSEKGYTRFDLNINVAQ